MPGCAHAEKNATGYDNGSNVNGSLKINASTISSMEPITQIFSIRLSLSKCVWSPCRRVLSRRSNIYFSGLSSNTKICLAAVLHGGKLTKEEISDIRWSAHVASVRSFVQHTRKLLDAFKEFGQLNLIPETRAQVS